MQDINIFIKGELSDGGVSILGGTKTIYGSVADNSLKTLRYHFFVTPCCNSEYNLHCKGQMGYISQHHLSHMNMIPKNNNDDTEGTEGRGMCRDR
jgi:hypothetical protein